MSFRVVVQETPFDVAEEYSSLQNSSPSVGAVATFVGLVRDVNQGKKIEKIFIEHYPGMTEIELQKILGEARNRWDILAGTIIHRFGKLGIGDGIVFVGVASSHRKDSISACDFIMDYLKTKAPFWKKEKHERGEKWVASRESDAAFLVAWDKEDN
ncbi:MAG: hypothetical protein CMQ40_11895 [Gammaproteobacteria bacterium]|nr:hypothetical protein [Gammaproteobacteria bacterium]|tara:strand:+ start:684 stop:1151 length:468 start_codon:yes stop_codon:yes gene_type:complete